MQNVTKRNIIKQLESLRNNLQPSVEWKKSNRDILICQIQAQVGIPVCKINKINLENSKWFFIRNDTLENVDYIFKIGKLAFLRYQRILMDYSLVSVALMLVMLGGSGFLIADASRASLPGDKLHGLKLALEKIDLIATSDKQVKIIKQLAIADTRFNEIKMLSIQNNRNENDNNIAQAAMRLEDELLKTTQAINTLNSISDGPRRTEVAKIIEKKVHGYTVSLNHTKRALINKEKPAALAVNKVIKTAVKVNSVALKVMASDIDSNKEVGSKVSSALEEDLTVLVTDKIQSTENKIKKLDKIATAGLEVAATTSSGLLSVSTTVIDKTELQGVKDTSKEATENLTKAKKYLQDKDYVAAIDSLGASQDIVDIMEAKVENSGIDVLTPTPDVTSSTSTGTTTNNDNNL